MPNACTEFAKAARYVRDWLVHQPNVKEETLTDWLLYRISRQLASVYYIAFSRHQEARVTGADWEWWIRFYRT